jgi:hypothetical protein
MTHWVCKPDGRIQCQDDPEIPLDAMRAELEALIGAQNVLGAKKISVIVIQMCGIPAGSFNAYEITDLGYYILNHGTVGPSGFRNCPGDGQPMIAFDNAAETPGLAQVIAAAGLGSAQSQPVLVRELIGRRVRVYEEGSPITEDYRPYRTNIVTKNGTIADIWFG